MENFTTSPPTPSTPEPPPPDLVLQVEVVPEESRLPETKTIDTSTTTFSTTSTTTIATTTAGSIPSSSAKTTAATTASTAMVSSSSSSSTSSPTTPQSGKSVLMDVLASGSPATTEESHKVVSEVSLSETELQLQKCLQEVSEFDKIREKQIVISSSSSEQNIAGYKTSSASMEQNCVDTHSFYLIIIIGLVISNTILSCLTIQKR